MRYAIKTVPEEFVVEEIQTLSLNPEGNYSVFVLEKTNWNTEDVLSRLAKFMGMKRSLVSAAGNKDKFATTSQLISVKTRDHERVEKFFLKGISLRYQGTSKEPIYLGNLEGNTFRIKVHLFDEQNEELMYDFSHIRQPQQFFNYFGVQRFSTNNVAVGRALLQRKFAKAANLIGVSETNPIQELRSIPKKTLLIYIHAYQSYLWNEEVKQQVTEGKTLPEKIPLVGFDTDLEYVPISKAALAEDGLTTRSFIFRELPFLTCEGTQRKTLLDVKELTITQEGWFSFHLPKAAYATEVIRQIMEANDVQEKQ
ncbi:MAG: tRNA pseudouridine(13) synthase TruD [Candidatus Woesearchaeota archaeon]|nr:MAG: tRNA pseudouridine(13) synthase TruD [Candidatus Woesearchaeota archaeon]